MLRTTEAKTLITAFADEKARAQFTVLTVWPGGTHSSWYAIGSYCFSTAIPPTVIKPSLKVGD